MSTSAGQVQKDAQKPAFLRDSGERDNWKLPENNLKFLSFVLLRASPKQNFYQACREFRDNPFEQL